MSLSMTLYPLLSTGSAQVDPSRHNRKIVDWDIKNQHNQTKYQELGSTCYMVTIVFREV